MKLIAISEERLDELVKKCLDDTFRSPDPSTMERQADHRTVNYHLCRLKDAVKSSSLT